MYIPDKTTLPECVKVLNTRTHIGEWCSEYTRYELTVYDEQVIVTMYSPEWNAKVEVNAGEYGYQIVGPFMSYPYAMRGAIQAALDLVDPMNERGEED